MSEGWNDTKGQVESSRECKCAAITMGFLFPDAVRKATVKIKLTDLIHLNNKACTLSVANFFEHV